MSRRSDGRSSPHPTETPVQIAERILSITADGT
jgi:hypothetical protein